MRNIGVTKRRHGALLLLLLAFVAAVAAACDGDYDDGGGATPAATAAVSPSPDVERAITIDEPAPNASVTVPITVSGSANVFEGALIVEVSDASGRSICRRNVQATSGTGTPGTWSTVIAFAPPTGGAPMRVRAFSLSPRDGSQENEVEHVIEVSGERPPIVIEQPGCGFQASEGDTLNVSGTARVFEATLQLELRDAGGTVVDTLMVTAASGTGEAPWVAAIDLSGVPPGQYDVVGFEHSAEDGTRQNDFPVPITVTE